MCWEGDWDPKLAHPTLPLQYLQKDKRHGRRLRIGRSSCCVALGLTFTNRLETASEVHSRPLRDRKYLAWRAAPQHSSVSESYNCIWAPWPVADVELDVMRDENNSVRTGWWARGGSEWRIATREANTSLRAQQNTKFRMRDGVSCCFFNMETVVVIRMSGAGGGQRTKWGVKM